MLRRFVSCLFALSAAALPTLHSKAQTGAFYLHDGDHVLFYGDSITDQRLYTQIIETYVATHYPKLDISYINSGWGGDTVNGGGGGDIATRLTRDVLPYKPSVVTIMLGMNDGGYKPATAANDEKFFRGYRHIVETIRKDDPGARITLIEPSPYDNVTRPAPTPDRDNYNQALLGFGTWIKNYGHNNNLTVADGNGGFVAALRKANDLNPEVARGVLPDHVHPSFGGALLLAEGVLKAWNPNAVIADVRIDAANNQLKLNGVQHANVTDLKSSGAAVTWTETDEALPLPTTQWGSMWGGGPQIPLAIASSDFTETLNEEPLHVTGLKAGNYRLSIDGTEVGMYTDAQLAQGVNLATLVTPMSEQAMRVYTLITQHGDLHYARWRNVQVALASNGLPEQRAAMDNLDALDAAMQQQARQAAQPKPHNFAVTLVQ